MMMCDYLCSAGMVGSITLTSHADLVKSQCTGINHYFESILCNVVYDYMDFVVFLHSSHSDAYMYRLHAQF